jgi:hypothetical protein
MIIPNSDVVLLDWRNAAVPGRSQDWWGETSGEPILTINPISPTNLLKPENRSWNGERTRLACHFPRLRGKPQAYRKIPKVRVKIMGKSAGREARPATPGAGVLPSVKISHHLVPASLTGNRTKQKMLDVETPA